MIVPVSLKGTAAVTQPLAPSIFYVPPVEKSLGEKIADFFESFWRILLDVVFLAISIALIPLTGGLSLGLQFGIQVGADLLFAGIDTALDAVEGRDINSSTLLNFIPVIGGAALQGAGALVRALAKSRNVAEAVEVISRGTLQANDTGPSFRFLSKFRTGANTGDISFVVNKTVLEHADSGTLKSALRTAFRDQVWSSKAFAQVGNGKRPKFLDYGAFDNQSRYIEMEISRRASEYVDAYKGLKASLKELENARKASEAAKGRIVRNIVKYYKVIKKVIARIKLLFDLPSRLIKFGVKRAAKYIRRNFVKKAEVVAVRKARATKIRDRLPDAAQRVMGALNLIPLPSSWILGVKVVMRRSVESALKLNSQFAAMALVGASLEENIPNDPGFIADVWFIFDARETRHDGMLTGTPHARWGIVGPPERIGKRPVRILMNGVQINEMLNEPSPGRWYLETGRNMARASSISTILQAVASAAKTPLANKTFERIGKSIMYGVRGVQEALYWKQQVQFVYFKVKSVEDGSFFDRLYNPQKFLNVLTKNVIGSVLPKHSLGNTIYRAAYAAARGDRRGLRLLTQHQLRTNNQQYRQDFRRVRATVNTGRRLSANNLLKLSYNKRNPNRRAIKSPFSSKITK